MLECNCNGEFTIAHIHNGKYAIFLIVNQPEMAYMCCFFYRKYTFVAVTTY